MEHNLFDLKTVASFLGISEGKLFAKTESKYFSFLELLDLAYEFDSNRTSDDFKHWVAERMTKYLKTGLVVNEQRFEQIRKVEGKKFEGVLELMKRYIDIPSFDGMEKDLITLIEDYSETWDVFHHYDDNTLSHNKVLSDAKYKLTYSKSQKLIEQFTKEMSTRGISSDVFAKEVGNKLEGLVEGLNQTFEQSELYTGVEIKAANLLYLLIKDHPFVDGNKRIAAMLFLYFLEKNGYAWKASNERKLNDNALVALTLLVAASDPTEKETMITLIVRLLQNDKV